jgi:hypothetical protein
MFELVMRTFHLYQKPPIGFQLLDDLPAIHGLDYTHCRGSDSSLALRWD